MEVLVMYDEGKMKKLRTLVMLIDIVLMFVTMVLETTVFQALLVSILCACVLLLTTVTLVFDGILKDSKNMFTHGLWYTLWFLNMIITLFNF